MAHFGDYESIPGLVANSTGLASYQYCPVKLASTAGQVILGAGITDLCIGVLQNDPGANEPADVAFRGICKIKAGGVAITAGSFVMCNSTGRGKIAATGNSRILGQAIEASVSDGDLIRLKLQISNL